MKKTLIAVAALAATGAFAQSSVQLYGRVDFGYAANTTTNGALDALGAVVSTKVKSTQWAGGDSQRTSDRLGVMGTEDLGGGLKAGFQYEMGLTPDDTAGTAFSGVREGNLSLSGNFGTVKLGTMTNVFDGFVGGTWHNATGLFGGVVSMPTRTTNTIAYVAPAFSNVTLGVATFNDKADTKVGAAATTTVDVKGYVLSAAYTNGPLNATAGYGKVKSSAGYDVAFGGWNATTSTAAFGGGVGKANDVTTFGLKGSYDLGVAVPYALYATNKLDNTAGTLDAKFSGFEVGATFPMGAVTPFISFVSGKGSDNMDGLKYTGYEAGAAYALSKRTTAYATFGSKKVKEDTLGDLRKVNAAAIGVAHTF